MLITVMNFRGGVGKSSISAHFAYEIGKLATVYTNDDFSTIDHLFDIIQVKTPDELPADTSSGVHIFDLAGQISPIQKALAERSDVIVIPISIHPPQFITGLKTAAAILKTNNDAKIIFAMTMVKNEKHYLTLKEILDKQMPGCDVFPIIDSTAFDRMTKEGKSIRDLINDNRGFTKNYTGVFNQMQRLLKHTIQTAKGVNNG